MHRQHPPQFIAEFDRVLPPTQVNAMGWAAIATGKAHTCGIPLDRMSVQCSRRFVFRRRMAIVADSSENFEAERPPRAPVEGA